MHYNHPTTGYATTMQPPLQNPNTLIFETPSVLTLENGLEIWDIKPKKPKRSYHISRPVVENPEITEINIYTEQLSLGGAWQGEIIAPISNDAASGTATHYRVKNIWLELIRHQLERNTKTYTFRIQSAFMVPLPEIVYLYQQNSRIVINEHMVKCNM